MNLKRIIGIAVCIGGIVLILISNYIKSQVEEGKEEISDAESKVQRGKTLFGLNPYTEAIGQKIIFDPAEKKIDTGKQEISSYEAKASQFMIAGIIVIVVGIGIILIPFGRKKR